MKAAICHSYGPPQSVRISTLPDPAPGPDEVLIAVHASTVASADRRIRAMDMPRGFGLMARAFFGFRGPRRPVLGTDAAGVIVAVGTNVRNWQVGQQVIAAPGARMGAHAQLLVIKASGTIAPKPASLDHADAAALIFGGTAALYFLRDRAGLQSGETVLVTGAGGAVGSAAVQIARAMGGQVTAMAGADKVAALRALGITDLIPSGQAPDSARQWDVIVDCAGIVSLSQARVWLAPNGRLCQVLAGLPQMLAGMVTRLGEGRRALSGTAVERAEDLQTLAKMADAGQFRPLIGARFPLDQIVQAHRLADSRAKLGNIVIEMPPQGS